MKKNILNEYNILMDEIENMEKTDDLENQYELELYRKVNDRIEDILSKSNSRVEKLETLICTFEARSTQDSYNATVALAYVAVSFNFGILTNVIDFSQNRPIIICITIGISFFATILFAQAWKERKSEQNRTFILNLLRFRYEELKNREALAQKMEDNKTNKQGIRKNKKEQ